MDDLSTYRKTDLVDDVLAADFNRLVDSALRGELSNTETLSADKTLTDAKPAGQYLNCNGADRIVTLPAPATTNHPFYIFNNTSSLYTITVKNSAAVIVGLLYPGDGGLFVSDGVAYRLFNTVQKLPDGTVENGKFAITISSNNLVCTLTDKSGNTPTATSPVYVWIAGVRRAVTSALSVTVTAGTNIFNAGAAEFAAQNIDFFVHLSWRSASSAVVIGVSRIPWPAVYSDFSGTSTNEKYGAFSTAPGSTDDVVNIGRFRAQNSGTASYNWSSVSQSAPTTENTVQRPIFDTSFLTYTPSWTGGSPAIGNGTIVGRYKIKNGQMWYHWNTTAGSTTTFGSGSLFWSLPFTAAAYTSGGFHVTAFLFDSSAGIFYIGVQSYVGGAAIGSVRVSGVSGAVNSTNPVTLATSDQIGASGEIAIN